MKKLFVADQGKSIENISSPLAYDAVMLLARAITRAGSLDRPAIRDAIAATVDFPGATGPITFDGNGDPHNKAIIIIEFRDRKRLFRSVVLPAPTK
jgi:branched-chain amino acid transport system substrate-binding protein